MRKNNYKTKSEIEAQLEDAEIEVLSGVDIPALFSSELPDYEVEFTIGGAVCSANFKPMTADALARWQDSTSKFSTVEKDGDTAFMFEPTTADADLKLLIGTVVDMKVYTNQQLLSDGEPTGQYKQVQYPFPGPGRGREDFFKRMHPELRKRLVNEAKRVNGLSPFSQKVG